MSCGRDKMLWFIEWKYFNSLDNFITSYYFWKISFIHEIVLFPHHDIQKQPPEVFYKKGVLKNFAKFTGNHLCQSLFFNKVAGLRPVTLLRMNLWHRCFPVNFEKFLRTPFWRNTSGILFLDIIFSNAKKKMYEPEAVV